jgi:glycosyltransferase involved in cell wall biosynthesis
VGNDERGPSAVAICLAGCDLGRSGIGVFAREVLPRLARSLGSRGVQTLVIGTKAEREAMGLDRYGGVALPEALAVPGVSVVFSLLALPALARALGADVLYLPAANRRVVGWRAVPTAGTVHDLAQVHVPNKYGRLRQVYVERVLLPLLRKLSAVTVVSQSTADDVVRYASVPRERVRVVPNGVELAEADCIPLCGSRPYLLYAARLEHPGKNHVRLVRAFGRSRARRTHALLLVGADWGAGAMIRQLVSDLGLGGQVSILGYVPRAALAGFTRRADAVVAAGLFEGFGLQAAEGLSAGKPVAASNTGALPEVVGDCGVLFDPTDESSMAEAIDRVVSDRELRHRCGEIGPVRAERFSWDRAAAAIGDTLWDLGRAAA